MVCLYGISFRKNVMEELRDQFKSYLPCPSHIYEWTKEAGPLEKDKTFLESSYTTEGVSRFPHFVEWKSLALLKVCAFIWEATLANWMLWIGFTRRTLKCPFALTGVLCSWSNCESVDHLPIHRRVAANILHRLQMPAGVMPAKFESFLRRSWFYNNIMVRV